MKSKELCHGLGSVLSLTLWIMLSMIVSSGSTASDLATLSQYDPGWPLDGRTAFLLVNNGNGPLQVHELQWRGEFYGGEVDPIARFRIRLYEDRGQRPGLILAETILTQFSVEHLGEEVFAYDADLPQPIALPPGIACWAEVQALAPAIPQWGILAIERPETTNHRLMICPTLGVLRWSEPPRTEEPHGGSDPLGQGTANPQVEPVPLVGVYPNPPSTHLLIAFDIPERTELQVAVYDVSGRLIRKLADKPFGPGRHHIRWNLHGLSGERVASGIYLARVFAGCEEVTRCKIVLLD